MKTVYRWTLALSFGWYAAQGVCAERLGGISDETAPPATQPQAVEAEGGITYRVICSPEGEMLPECGQPPISDSLAAEPTKTVGPEMPAAAEVQEQASEQTLQNDQANEVAEPAPPKKASSHKKRSKKTVKKTAKPAKKRKRH